MKAMSEFEIEEYEKMLSMLDLPDMDEDKTQYFNVWSFGKSDGDYTVSAELSQGSEE